METALLAPARSTTLQLSINVRRSRPPPPALFLTGWTSAAPARPAPALVTRLYDVIICVSAVYFIPLIRAGFQSEGLTLESWGFKVSHCTCVWAERSASAVSHPLRKKDLMRVTAMDAGWQMYTHTCAKSLQLFGIINTAVEKSETWNVEVAWACMQRIALKLGSLRRDLSDFSIAHKSPSSAFSTWYPRRDPIISQTAVHAIGFTYDCVIWKLIFGQFTPKRPSIGYFISVALIFVALY